MLDRGKPISAWVLLGVGARGTTFRGSRYELPFGWIGWTRWRDAEWPEKRFPAAHYEPNDPERRPEEMSEEWLDLAPAAGRLVVHIDQDPSAGEPGGLTGVGGYHPHGLIRTADDPQPIMTRLAPNGRLCPWFIWSQVDFWEDAACPPLEEIAPVYRDGSRILLPAITGRLLSPLMLWWVLLFGLSSVASYDPEVWVAALDVNTSEQAVPIEAALDVALEALPELILDALTS